MRAACACLAAVASLPTISALSPAEGPQPRTEFTIARTEAPEETQGALADLLARRLEEYDLSYSYDGELTCPLLYECGRREVTCGSVVSGDTTGGIDCSAELEDNDDSPYAYSVHQDTKEMVYTLVLDEPGATVRISTCNEGTDANFDTYLHLLDGCVGTHLAYNDDDRSCATSWRHSEIIYTFEEAGEYTILVEGWGQNFEGEFELSIECGDEGDFTSYAPSYQVWYYDTWIYYYGDYQYGNYYYGDRQYSGDWTPGGSYYTGPGSYGYGYWTSAPSDWNPDEQDYECPMKTGPFLQGSRRSCYDIMTASNGCTRTLGLFYDGEDGERKFARASNAYPTFAVSPTDQGRDKVPDGSPTEWAFVPDELASLDEFELEGYQDIYKNVVDCCGIPKDEWDDCDDTPVEVLILLTVQGVSEDDIGKDQKYHLKMALAKYTEVEYEAIDDIDVRDTGSSGRRRLGGAAVEVTFDIETELGMTHADDEEEYAAGILKRLTKNVDNGKFADYLNRNADFDVDVAVGGVTVYGGDMPPTPAPTYTTEHQGKMFMFLVIGVICMALVGCCCCGGIIFLLVRIQYGQSKGVGIAAAAGAVGRGNPVVAGTFGGAHVPVVNGAMMGGGIQMATLPSVSNMGPNMDTDQQGKRAPAAAGLAHGGAPGAFF